MEGTLVRGRAQSDLINKRSDRGSEGVIVSVVVSVCSIHSVSDFRLSCLKCEHAHMQLHLGHDCRVMYLKMKMIMHKPFVLIQYHLFVM